MKIFATFGPSTNQIEDLVKLIESGMNGIRINLSHANLDEVAGWLNNLKEAEKITGKKVELLADIQGKELRITTKKTELGLLNSNTYLMSELFVVPDQLADVITANDFLEIDDGKIVLQVTKKLDQDFQITVINGGILKNKKSVLVQNKAVKMPLFTENDLKNINDFKKYHIDSVMLPFIERREELVEYQNYFKTLGLEDLIIYTKIENLVGVNNLEDFIDLTDYVVIARGDLANAVNIHEIGYYQDTLIRKSLKHQKPFLIVTDFLSSMIDKPLPTRAEVSDIYNATVKGASALMLTNETAISKDPIRTFQIFTQVIDTGIRRLNEDNAL